MRVVLASFFRWIKTSGFRNCFLAAVRNVFLVRLREKPIRRSGNDPFWNQRYMRFTPMAIRPPDSNSAVNPGKRSMTISRKLKDPRYPFFVSLLFKAYARENIIEQWVEIRHQEKAAVALHQFASAAPSLGQGDYYLTYYHGGWANEMNREEEKLGFGVKTLASRLGSRAHMNLNPSFLLSPGAPAQENTGEVFGATFAYSGNFQFQFEVDPDHRLRTICGINPEASPFKLLPGKPFVNPSMIWGYSDKGRGELARQFARWGRSYGMRDGNIPRPILLNNWEATYFDFDENKLVALFDGAKALGMELFLLDDGWFGNKFPRRNDGQGLGDWQVTKTVLPHGLSFLTDEARKRGLRFGLWLEPEIVNPKSELFEKHPDWAIRQPGRELQLERNQLVLDLSNPAVREWMFQTVDRLLTDNPGITYIKWDCNRVITQPGSPYLKSSEQSHLFIEYYNAYYSVLSRIAKKHPSVKIMNCSGAGGVSIMARYASRTSSGPVTTPTRCAAFPCNGSTSSSTRLPRSRPMSPVGATVRSSSPSMSR